jgi:hypothetical protein
MIPVAHLAREGYVPSAMAMVLCNDPDVQGFCAMVQGLHQEGVVGLFTFVIVIILISNRHSIYQMPRNYRSCFCLPNSIVPTTFSD